MPFAQRGYPQKNRELFAQTFPADYISEAIDQTRGWFYSLLAISTLNFGQNSYRNVICLGHILDAEGLKMSKSRGNIMDPDQAFAEFGVDAVRWLFFTQQVGESYRLGAKTLQEVVRRFLLTIWNVYSFFVTYANVDGFAPGLEEPVPVGERPALDRWLLARLNGLVRTVGQSLDAYDVNGAARPVEGFVEDLSNWYVRRSRRRFWKSSSDRDKLAAYQTLHTCLVTMSRLLAPFTPFVADSLHRNLAGSSAHLAGFPEPDPALLDEALEAHMRVARQIVADGLAERDKARIKVRQPLRALDVPFEPLPDEIDAIVRDELNVKEVRYNRPLKLDTEITRDLMLEGKARDLVRLINAERKAAGLNVDDRVVLYWWATGEYEEAFLHYGGYIGAEVLAVQVIRERPAGLAGSDLGENLWIGLKRAG
jgi:isoleucyl-tRNA synthetase